MKLIKRKPEHDQIRCDFCGYKIAIHNGEFVYKNEFDNTLVGLDHERELQSKIGEF